MIGFLTRHIVFAPPLPFWLLATVTIATLVTLALGFVRQAPGTTWRAAACAIGLLWLAGPRWVVRTGQALPDVALLVVDHSASMQVGERARIAQGAAAAIARGASGLQIRRVDVPEAGSGGTKLFGTIDAALADIPADQRAGVIAVTDGAVADTPPHFDLPLHVLIPAHAEQIDRRLRILRAPGFGIVNQTVHVDFQVDDLGATTHMGTARLTWTLDGTPEGQMEVTTGQPSGIDVKLARPGPLTIGLAVEALPGEASLLNNRAALSVNGVRDRLRVLLISGEPHAGERTWRRLLKADPAVDLVHFTILRPPGKDDMTPINELALIAFPTRELFVDKIRQFDLIILDRFADPGILPPSYLQNIADYVRGGGALLVSAGPEYGSAASIARGPIGSVLPAQPLDGQDGVISGEFRAAVSTLGRRHPVTASLPGDRADGSAHWGPWYRRIETTDQHGEVVMTAGVGGPPLLLLDHVGEGRVALLLSDQIWLWSRGHEGGGPQAELLRRVAHWLMAEPELSENALTARIGGGMLTVTRHALAAAGPAAKLIVTDPDGNRQSVLLLDGPGGESASVAATLPGTWQVDFGTQHAAAAAIPSNLAEYMDLRATATRLRSLARSVHWIGLAPVPSLSNFAMRHNHAIQLTGISEHALLPAWVAALLLLATLLAGWRREGR